MNSVKTWQAQIFCGLRVGYSKSQIPLTRVHDLCQGYANKVGWGITVTPTRFIYKDGWENGAIIGIIQYPRFPLEVEVLKNRVLELAKLLLCKVKQLRISIVFPDETILIGEP